MNQNTQQKQKYDPFQIPCSIEDSLIHYRAQKIGKIQNLKDKEVCNCCHLNVNKKKFSLLQNPNEFKILGSAYTLYFQFCKIYFLMILSVFTIAGISEFINMVTYCQYENHECLQFLFIVYASEDSKYLDLDTQIWLNMGAIIFLCFIIGYIKFYIQEEGKRIQGTQLRRLAIKVNNINKAGLNEADIKQHFNSISGGQVQKVVIFYQINQHIQNIHKKAKILQKQKEIQRQIKNNEDNEDQLEKFQQKEEKIKSELFDINQSIYNFEKSIEVDDLEYFALDQAIVVFKDSKTQQDILKQYKSNWFLNLMFQMFGRLYCKDINQYKKKELIISETYDPMDIIYENQQFGFFYKFFFRFLSLILVGGVMTGGFYLLELIMLLEVRSHRQSDFLSVILGFLYSFLIVFINLIIRITIYIETPIEKQLTYTQHYSSMCWKLSISQFVMSCILPYYLFIKYSEEFNGQELIENIFYLFVANSFIMPASLLFDPYHMFLSIRKWYVKQAPNKYFQFQANQIFDPPAFDIAEKYAAINKTVLSAMFFLPIFPQGALLELISILFQYWACKYVLVNRCGFKHKVSSKFSNQMLLIIQFSPFCYTLGACLQNLMVDDELFSRVGSVIVCFVFSVLTFFSHHFFFIVIPYYRKKQQKKKENQGITDKKKKKQDKILYYNEIINIYGIDYDLANPVSCLKNKVREKSKTQLQSEMQDVFDDNINNENNNNFVLFNDNDIIRLEQIQNNNLQQNEEQEEIYGDTTTINYSEKNNNISEINSSGENSQRNSLVTNNIQQNQNSKISNVSNNANRTIKFGKNQNQIDEYQTAINIQPTNKKVFSSNKCKQYIDESILNDNEEENSQKQQQKKIKITQKNIYDLDKNQNQKPLLSKDNSFVLERGSIEE